MALRSVDSAGIFVRTTYFPAEGLTGWSLWELVDDPNLYITYSFYAMPDMQLYETGTAAMLAGERWLEEHPVHGPELPTYYAVRNALGLFDLRQSRYRDLFRAGNEHPHDLMAVGFGAAELRATIAKFGWDADLTALPPAGGA